MGAQMAKLYINSTAAVGLATIGLYLGGASDSIVSGFAMFFILMTMMTLYQMHYHSVSIKETLDSIVQRNDLETYKSERDKNDHDYE
jgi:hypothetical protein